MTAVSEREDGHDLGTQVHLVTGGGGYPGFELAKALVTRGHRVILLDLRPPAGQSLPEGMTFIKADVSHSASVLSACEGVDCVYHMASYGMSGRDQLNRRLIEAVNVQGTRNVIEGCRVQGVGRLVYTSTYNVVFGGQEIINGDESMPYLPLHLHPDHYSRTKSIAESLVLQANGQSVCGRGSGAEGEGDGRGEGGEGGVLRTCALRLAGVYGPGEQRHLPRIVGYVERGWFAFTYGREDSLVDFLHVDNLVQAHMLAGQALQPPLHTAAGKAYFISDNKPINNFLFFRPLVEGLGYRYPSVRLPLSLVYFIAFITELLHSVLGRIYNFQPLLTRTEVYKTGVTHYFSVGRARTELGYVPHAQNDLGGVLAWYRERGYGTRSPAHSPHSKFVSVLVSVLLAVLFTVILLACLPTVR